MCSSEHQSGDPSDLGHAPPTLGTPHHSPQPLMCPVGMSKVPDTPEQLPSGVCLAPQAGISCRCYFLGQRQGQCPPGRQWGRADVGGNTSPLQSLPPPIPVRLHSPTSLALSLSLSLSHTHTHTHTYTELPKGKKPALRVQTPDPEDSSLQGCSQQLEGLRFPRGNPPALLPPASCRADGPHPGPMFPGSRPHPFLPAQGGGGWGGLRLPAYPRLLVWTDCPLPARLPVALGGIQSSSTGSMNPPVAVAFELPLTDVRGRMCRLVAQLHPTLCDPSRASLSVGFSRREYWRGWPLPSPGRGRMVASKTSTPKPWIL